MKVSVILTSYNHEDFILESIKSILNQTYTNFELIIIDDCSTDKSWELINSVKDKRIRAVRNEKNRGGDGIIFDTIQKYAIGEYCAIAHSDDVWKPEKLEKQVRFLESNSDIAACFTLVDVIMENGDLIDNSKSIFSTIFESTNKSRFEWLNHFFYKGNPLCHPSLLIRKEMYTECNLDVRGLTGLPDFCQWIRLCLTKEIHVLQERLSYFRVRNQGKNTSGDSFENRNLYNIENFLILKEYLHLSPQEFKRVFQQTEKYCGKEEVIVEFAFAKILLEESNDHIKHLYGNFLLDRLYADSTTRGKLESLYGYTINEQKKDKTKFDIFSTTSPLRLLNSTLFFDSGKGFNKDDKITINNIYVDLNNNFQVDFDIKEMTVNKQVTSLYFEPDNKSIKKYKIEYIKVDGIEQNFEPLNPMMTENGFDVFCDFNPAYTISLITDSCKKISISGKAVDYTNESIRILNDKIKNMQYKSGSIMDMEKIDIIKERYGDFGNQSNVKGYLDNISDLLSYKENSLFKETYSPLIEKNEKNRTNTPFLSIITRTQGKRPEALRETLLCLSGQSDTDFEILLIGHKISDEGNSLVEEIIDEQTEELKSRIRYIKLNHGGRATPLNYGFASAYGEYIAVLDDDDTVLDNWVDEFHKEADRNHGKVLHSYILGQKWEIIKKTGALRAIEKPLTIYCKEFIFLNQLSVNNCPLNGLAFPAYSFKKLGIIFDESLNTTEDWDFLMRTVFLCGISDIKKVTGFYRLWSNTENSATLHDQKEWDSNREKIIKKYIKAPIALNESWVRECMEHSDRGVGAVIFNGSRLPNIYPKLYYDLGSGFNEGYSIEGLNDDNVPHFHVEYKLPDSLKNLKRIRFDVSEDSFFLMENCLMSIKFKNGKEEKVPLSEFKHNGYKFGDRILYLKKDPQIVFNYGRDEIPQALIFEGEISYDITDEMINRTIRNTPKEYLKKLVRKIKR